MSTTAIQKMTRGSQFLDHAHVVVGTAAVQISSRKDIKCKQGIVLYANVSNSNNIWIGRLGVTADNNVITGGFVLTPGSSLELPIEELLNIYARSDAATQDLMWIGV